MNGVDSRPALPRPRFRKKWRRDSDMSPPSPTRGRRRVQCDLARRCAGGACSIRPARGQFLPEFVQVDCDDVSARTADLGAPAGYFASWKITPAVCRWPERTRLTPWRIVTR